MNENTTPILRLNNLRLQLMIGVIWASLFALLLLDIKQHFKIDGTKKYILLGRDFINYYSSSVLVLKNDLHLLHDLEGYRVFQREFFEAPLLSIHNWSYPPHSLLFTWPLSFFPYLLSLAIWSVVGLGAFYKATRLYIANRFDAWIVVLAPASIICLVAGQNGLFSATLMVAPFMLKEKSPWLAGILLGCLTYKPQLGLLLPIAFILMRDWKVILSAGLTTVTLVAVSLGLFGVQSWISFVNDIVPYQVLVLNEMGPPFANMVASLFKSATIIGIEKNIAMTAQSILTVSCMLFTVWVFWRRRNYNIQLAFLFTAILLSSPYLVIYDMVPLALAVYLYYRDLSLSGDLRSLEPLFLVIVATLPFTTYFLSTITFPIAPVILIVFLARLVFKLKQGESSSWVPISVNEQRT